MKELELLLPEEWCRSDSELCASGDISIYTLGLPGDVAFLLLVPPRGHHFGEFRISRRLKVSQQSWLGTSEYRKAEVDVKSLFAKARLSKKTIPQIGSQSSTRLHLAVPKHAVEFFQRHFEAMQIQCGSRAISSEPPWNGESAAGAPDSRWVLALTNWPEAANSLKGTREAALRELTNAAISLPDSRDALPLSMSEKISIAAALTPLPAKGTYVPDALLFSELHLARAKLIRAVCSPSFYGVTLAHLNFPMADMDHPILRQWAIELKGFLAEADLRFPFLGEEFHTIWIR